MDSAPARGGGGGCESTIPGAVTQPLGHLGLTSPFPPTCVTEGNSEDHGQCARQGSTGCGNTVIEGTILPALGHEGLSDPIPPTCTEIGSTGHGDCTRPIMDGGCNKNISDTPIPALGHEGLTPAFVATCTTEGNSEPHGQCVRDAEEGGCEEFFEGIVVPAWGHLGLTAPHVETCLTDGNEEYYGACTRQGAEGCHSIVEGTKLPRLGHDLLLPIVATCVKVGNYSPHGECTRCDFSDVGVPYGPILSNHTWSNESSEIRTGIKGKHCTNEGCESHSLKAGIKEDLVFTYKGGTGPAGGKIIYVADGLDGRPLGFTVQGYSKADYFDYPGSPKDDTDRIDYPEYFPAYIAYYLEAHPGERITSVRWGIGTTTADSNTNVLLGGVSSITSNSTSSNVINIIGNGRRDSYILAAHSLKINLSDRAGPVSVSRTYGDFTDWFLPSFGETQLFAGFFDNNDQGTFWTSTENAINRAWSPSINNAGVISNGSGTEKHTTRHIRVIRAF